MVEEEVVVVVNMEVDGRCEILWWFGLSSVLVILPLLLLVAVYPYPEPTNKPNKHQHDTPTHKHTDRTTDGKIRR